MISAHAQDLLIPQIKVDNVQATKTMVASPKVVSAESRHMRPMNFSRNHPSWQTVTRGARPLFLFIS